MSKRFKLFISPFWIIHFLSYEVCVHGFTTLGVTFHRRCLTLTVGVPLQIVYLRDGAARPSLKQIKSCPSPSGCLESSDINPQ